MSNANTKPIKHIYKIVISINSHEYIRAEQLSKNIVAKLNEKVKNTSAQDYAYSFFVLPQRKSRFSLQDSPHAYGATRSTYGFDIVKAYISIGMKNSKTITSEQLQLFIDAITSTKEIPGVLIRTKIKSKAVHDNGGSKPAQSQMKPEQKQIKPEQKQMRPEDK